MSSGSATSVDLDRQRPALRREPDRRQRALADDHRVDELDRDVAGVGARRSANRRAPPAGRLSRTAPPSDGSSAPAARPPSSKKTAVGLGAQAEQIVDAPRRQARRSRLWPPSRLREDEPVQEVVASQGHPLERARLGGLGEPKRRRQADLEAEPGRETIDRPGPRAPPQRLGQGREGRAAGRPVGPVGELDRRPSSPRGTLRIRPRARCLKIASGGVCSTMPRSTVKARIPVIAIAAIAPRRPPWSDLAGSPRLGRGRLRPS